MKIQGFFIIFSMVIFFIFLIVINCSYLHVDSCIKMSTKPYGTKIKFLLASILGLQMEKDQIDQRVSSPTCYKT